MLATGPLRVDPHANDTYAGSVGVILEQPTLSGGYVEPERTRSFTPCAT